MINAFRSEWVKLRRRPMLLGGLGAMAGVSALASFIAVSSAGSTGSGPGGRFATLTGADLTAAGGLAQVLSGGATLLGVVALCVVAAAVAGDFSHGTLRGQLIREPRRHHLTAHSLSGARDRGEARPGSRGAWRLPCASDSGSRRSTGRAVPPSTP